MGAVTLSQVQGIPDIIDQTRFLLKLGNVPGGGDTETLSIRCFNAVLPGSSTEIFEANMHGYKRKFRGRKIYTNLMSVSYYEDVNADSHSKILQWLEAMAGTESGNSIGYIDAYSVTAELSVYDTTGAESMRYHIFRMMPSELQDTNLSAESSAPMQVQLQFSYDYFESTNFTTR